jgi:ABC-2 type transport system permease protein
MAELRGEVFDLRYQRYEGPREGRWRTRYAIFENGLCSMLGIGRGGRSKVLPILLVLAAIALAAVFVIIVSVLGDDDFIPGPSDYYQIVSLVLFLFSAIMAPELLITERRDRVLDLYLVRPLMVTDYLVARVAAYEHTIAAIEQGELGWAL